MDCEKVIDSGYRWCYCELEEPGIVERGKPVDVSRVLACEGYWDIASEGRSHGGWLEALMPKVREFLQEHRQHKIVFGELTDFDELFDDVSP